MATLRDVAVLAGVSISVTSRVLGNDPAARARPETRERIHAAARELDYRPNFAGRALKKARSNVIVLIIPDVSNAVFAELMSGVEEAALEHDYLVLLGKSEDMQPGGNTISRLIREGRVDGMLVQLGDNVTRDGVESLLREKAPMVFINSLEAGHVGAVALDDEEGARVATEHLIRLGHRRIGFANGTTETFTAQRREKGFRAAMAAAGLVVENGTILSFGYKPEDGRAAMRELMALAEPPTALFIANVNAAIGALAEARALGVRVPEDLSVIAMHDVWTAEHTWPALTTVKMPLRELGRYGVQSLYEKLQGDEFRDIIVNHPPPRLILRDSTAPLNASGIQGFP